MEMKGQAMRCRCISMMHERTTLKVYDTSSIAFPSRLQPRLCARGTGGLLVMRSTNMVWWPP